MRSLTSTELLKVWEENLNKSLVHKSMHLLAVAYSVSDMTQLTHLSIGDRDSKLFQLREWMFGTRLVNLANCPQCLEHMEWEMSTQDFLHDQVQGLKDPDQFDLSVDDFQLRFRLPNSNDLINAVSNQEYQKSPDKILKDCIVHAKRKDQNYGETKFPDSVLKALDEQINQKDPKANISILLSCQSCDHQWEIAFDILSYLWTEIDNWAKHILQEIYTLARAFSWSEKDILEMSPRRRRMYLQMLYA